jgi:hypothetical protein
LGPVGLFADNEPVPERTVTGLTQATLKFAAGDDQARVQVSSTWYVRFTRGAEFYVFNREAGGNRAHISFHKDGRCHYKVDDPSGRGRVVADWELPGQIEETGMLRLATVVIPNLGLVLPANFQGVQDDTVLIPPPGVDECLEVDILLEPGPVPKGRGLVRQRIRREALWAEARCTQTLLRTVCCTSQW